MHHSEAFLKLVNDAKARIREIDITGYQAMRAQPHALIDVREESEFAAGHVKGAVPMSRGTIERDIEGRYPDKTIKLILYCGGGYRSALAADNLQKMGYADVISLDGDWRALKDSGIELEG